MRSSLMPSRDVTGILALVPLLCLPTCILQADEEKELVDLSLRQDWESSTPLGDSGTRLSKDESSAELSFPLGGNPQNAVLGDLVVSEQNYHFSGNTGPDTLPSRPLSLAHTLEFAPVLALGLEKPNTYLLGLTAEADWARGARFSQALRYTESFSVLHRITPSLRLGIGLEWEGRLNHEHVWMPVLLAEWSHQNWSFSADGSVARLSYLIQPKLSFFSRLEFLETDTRLSPQSSLPNGRLHEESIPLSLGCEWKLTKHLHLSAFFGASVWQLAEFENQDYKQKINSYQERSYRGGLAMNLSY